MLIWLWFKAMYDGLYIISQNQIKEHEDCISGKEDCISGEEGCSTVLRF